MAKKKPKRVRAFVDALMDFTLDHGEKVHMVIVWRPNVVTSTKDPQRMVALLGPDGRILPNAQTVAIELLREAVIAMEAMEKPNGG